MSAASNNNNQQANANTIVSLYDIDDLSAHHCGYCNQNGNISVGMSSEFMRIEDYQLLIDRGWRRSGNYIYKPMIDKTCCPLYTIKCDATQLRLKKSQKNVLNTFRRYLINNEKKPLAKKISPSTSNANIKTNSSTSPVTKIERKEIKHAHSINTNADKIKEFFLKENSKELIETFKNNKTTINDLLQIKRLKAKHVRLFKKFLKLKNNGLINNRLEIEKCIKKRRNSNNNHSIEDYLLKKTEFDALKLKSNNEPEINKIELKLVRSWPPSKQFHDTIKEEHDIYSKYQTKIHKDSPLECNMNQFQRFLCTSPLMPLSYQEGSLNKYANNPGEIKLIENELIGKLDNLGYGSFHQQYRLNGKLIAVGVLDILDKCVSSVYFFYDPDYQFLNLGTYSSLRELAFTRQLSKLDPNIKWYYMGFYAHSCKKMRYKGSFSPSYLLCPEVYSWHCIEKCIELLEIKKYNRFGGLEEEDLDKNELINDVRIRVKFKESEMKIFKMTEFCEFLNRGFVPQFKHLITGYCKLFGNKVSRRFML